MSLVFGDHLVADHERTSLSVVLTRSDDSYAATGLGFVIALPTGMMVGASDAELTDCTGGTVTADLMDTSVSLAGATMAIGKASCTLAVSIFAESSGGYTLTADSVSGRTGGVTGPATPETLTVTTANPELSAGFGDYSIDVRDSSTLTLNVWMTDRNPSASASGLGYTLTVPTNLVVGPTAYANTCGGTVTAAAGGTMIRLAGAAVTQANNPCQLELAIVANAGGIYTIDDHSASLVSGLTKQLSRACQNSVPDGEFTAQTSGCTTLTVNKIDQTLTFTKPADTSASAGTVILVGTSDSHLGVTFSSDTPSVCSVSGTIVSLRMAGNCTIIASQAGNAVYQQATPIPRTFVISAPLLLTQSITFAAPASVAVTAGTATLAATASSGLPVTFTSSSPLVCTISGNTVTLGSTGTCSIMATQAGNSAYGPATAVTQSFTITAGAQTINFAALSTTGLAQGSVTAAATASSELTVALTSSTPQVCTVSGRTITLVAAGLCTIAADQPGNDYYAAAVPVSRSFRVTVAPPSPGQVTAVAGISSITATWDAPHDLTGVTGYTAIASPGPATCSTSGATTCVMGGTAGVTYTITVVAIGADGNSEPAARSGGVTPTAPEPPAQVPPTDLTLTTDKGLITTAEPGQLVVFIGTGFAAFSTVTISIYSEPTVLGTVVTDGNGDFRKPITIPPDLLAGAHTAVAQGVAPDGTARAMTLAIAVADAVDPAVPNKPGGGGKLPVTGVSVAAILLAGLGSVVTGAGLLAAGRPRRRRSTAVSRVTG